VAVESCFEFQAQRGGHALPGAVCLLPGRRKQVGADVTKLHLLFSSGLRLASIHERSAVNPTRALGSVDAVDEWDDAFQQEDADFKCAETELEMSRLFDAKTMT
jgi:hypothetical protein